MRSKANTSQLNLPHGTDNYMGMDEYSEADEYGNSRFSAPGGKINERLPPIFFNSGIGAHQIACVRRPLDFYRESGARRWTVV